MLWSSFVVSCGIFEQYKIPGSGCSLRASSIPFSHLSKLAHRCKLIMSTASAPNRFWGVVTLALNSLLQPAGQICGGTSSPALRLSPPFQIANALSLIYHSVRLSFAIGQPFRDAMGVVAERVELYYGIKGPERRSYFRAFVFIFGALPAFIKAMAIQGDRVSYWLALGFIVPYIVLESIDLLGNQPTWDSRTVMPAEKRDAVIVFGLMVALFALVLHIYFCLETVNFALKKSLFEGKVFEQSKFINMFSPLVAAIGSSALKIYEIALKDMRSVLVGITLFVGSSLLLYTAILDFINLWGRWSEIASTILALTPAITGTLAHLFFYLRFTPTTLRKLFSGQDKHKQKFFEQWIALWTVACIFLYYGYLYDASGTYKPAWTVWLP